MDARLIETALLEFMLSGGTSDACRRCLQRIAEAAARWERSEIVAMMEREGVGEDVIKKVKQRGRP